MDIIFRRESANFLETLQKYINKEITYKELVLANLRVEAARFKNMSNVRKEIHEFKLNELRKAMELEKLIEMAKEEIPECLDIKEGLYIGCTSKNDYNTGLPPYPSMDMLTFGNDQDDTNDEKDDNFVFEF